MKFPALLLRLCGCALSVSALAAPSVTLEDFKTPNPESYWILRDVDAYHVPHGDSASLRLTYPKWQSGVDECPAAILNYGQGTFQTEDWSPYELLSFQLFHEADMPGRIELRLDDADGKQFFRAFPLEPQQSVTCSVPIAEIAKELNVKQMRHFNLWMLKPDAKRVITLGPIRLTNDPYTPQELERLRGVYAEAALETRRQLAGLPEAPAVTALCERLDEDIDLLQETASGDALIRNPEYPRQLADALQQARFLSTRSGDYSIVPVPSTLKLRPEQMPQEIVPAELDAARGEAESLGFLITANTQALDGVTVSCTPFTNADGATVEAELKAAGYVPVEKPTLAPCGFGAAGDYPDPLMPPEALSIPRFEHRLLWLTAWVPEAAEPGVYDALLTVTVPGLTPQELAVQLTVYPVTIPKQGKLKSCWLYRNEAGKSQYNGANWNDDSSREFIRLNAKYRLNLAAFNSNLELPWNRIFTESDGRVSADWAEWDQAVEYWMQQEGRNSFILNYPSGSPEIAGEKLRQIGEHLAEKGWSEYFYFYMFDEPAPAKTEETRQICVGVHTHAKNLNMLLTASYENIADYIGYADIFVPHINLVDPEFGRARIAEGNQYWVYTCVGTTRTTYPDTWKIDAPGAAPRALGWWMYRYNIQGYLYWAVDWWQVNPWTSTETFPGTNGDGSIFYPAPDHLSQPYPSIRLMQTRDGIEDYELLHLLQERYPDTTDTEILSLLRADGIVFSPEHYNRVDDALYIRQHRRLLELLTTQL